MKNYVCYSLLWIEIVHFYLDCNPLADSQSVLLAVVYFGHIICLQNLQLKSSLFLFSLHLCRKYQFSKHEKLYTLKIVITRQLQLYGYTQKYPDTQHAKWKVEEPWRFRECKCRCDFLRNRRGCVVRAM